MARELREYERQNLLTKFSEISSKCVVFVIQDSRFITRSEGVAAYVCVCVCVSLFAILVKKYASGLQKYLEDLCTTRGRRCAYNSPAIHKLL